MALNPKVVVTPDPGGGRADFAYIRPWLDQFGHRLDNDFLSVRTMRDHTRASTHVAMVVDIDKQRLGFDFHITDEVMATRSWDLAQIVNSNVERALEALWIAADQNAEYDAAANRRWAAQITTALTNTKPEPSTGKVFPKPKADDVHVKRHEPEPVRRPEDRIPPGAVRLRPPSSSERERRRAAAREEARK